MIYLYTSKVNLTTNTHRPGIALLVLVSAVISSTMVNSELAPKVDFDAAADDAKIDKLLCPTVSALGHCGDSMLLIGTACTFGNYWTGGLGIYSLNSDWSKKENDKRLDITPSLALFTTFEASVSSIATTTITDSKSSTLAETQPVWIGLDDGTIQFFTVPRCLPSDRADGEQMRVSINSATYHDHPIQRLLAAQDTLVSLDTGGIVKLQPTVTASDVGTSDVRMVLLMKGLLAPRRGFKGLFAAGYSGQFRGDGVSQESARMVEALKNGSVEINISEWTLNMRCTLADQKHGFEYEIQRFPDRISPTLSRFEIKNDQLIILLRKAPGTSSWAPTLETRGLH